MFEAVEMYPREPRIRWETDNLNDMLLWATGSGMSDIQLCSGQPVWVRKDGVWQRITTRPITTDELLAGLERHNPDFWRAPRRFLAPARACQSRLP